jgi:hypothetical protein
LACQQFHRRGAESAENIFSWSDFLRGKIKPNNQPSAKNYLNIIQINTGFKTHFNTK